MRKLILITRKLYVRDFLTAGAFEAIDDEDTWYTTGPSDVTAFFDDHHRYLGPTEVGADRARDYGDIRDLMLTHYRHRSRTQAVKLGERPFGQRMLYKAKALPGVRHAKIARRMRRTGLNQAMLEMFTRFEPDILIAPSSGIDAQVLDAFRVAKHLGVPSLGLMYNWDNLSSKAAFVVEPDYLGVVGNQSAEHATTIHGIPPERVAVLGSPYIDGHFRHEPGSTESPFPFKYVLFAGCYQPFDEKTALRVLNDEIERRGLDVKVVYLPHPSRLRRKVDEFVDDAELPHVVIEPHQRDAYIARYEKWRTNPKSRKMGLPPLPLDLYPALLENAEFVVCPLSTMMLEAAIFHRRVLAIAYHDGIHRTSPGVAYNYLHFEGVDRVDTFEVVRDIVDFGPTFARMASEHPEPRQPPKEQMDYWVYHDDRPYGERLREWVEEIGRRSGAGAEPASTSAQTAAAR